MKKQVWFKLVLIVVLAFGYFSGIIAAPRPAKALCIAEWETGNWHNINPSTNTITRVSIWRDCPDTGPVLANPYAVQIWGACVPTDCYWGAIPAHRDTASGWIVGTLYQGYAVRYVWVKAYSATSLRVYIWTDFADPARTDYAIDEWFVH